MMAIYRFATIGSKIKCVPGHWDARTGCLLARYAVVRAANVMTLIQSAKLNGLDPYAYLSDVLKRLPTHKVTQIEELLPHRWKPNSN